MKSPQIHTVTSYQLREHSLQHYLLGTVNSAAVYNQTVMLTFDV